MGKSSHCNAQYRCNGRKECTVVVLSFTEIYQWEDNVHNMVA